MEAGSSINNFRILLSTNIVIFSWMSHLEFYSYIGF